MTIDLGELRPEKLREFHNTSSFCCGRRDIDEFIQKQAKDFQKLRLGITHLWFLDDRLVAFVTLSMSDVGRKRMRSEDQLPIGVENYPAVLIGQLGVQEEYQGKGIGSQICQWCYGKAISLSEQIGCTFIVLNAEEDSIDWYLKRGFKLLPDQEKRRQKWLTRKIVFLS